VSGVSQSQSRQVASAFERCWLAEFGEIVHHTMTCSGVSQAQSAHHGEGFAASMADHANAIHTKEKCAAVFSVVEPFLDAFEIAA
jgi:hypothetical protein